MGISNWIKKKEKPVLNYWQITLLNAKNVRKEDFINHYGIQKISEMSEHSFKYLLEFYTKFGHNEQCDVYLDKVFEGFYNLDIPNVDYLSHSIYCDDGEFYIFENKCGRANFLVYKIDPNDDIINYDEKQDKYSLVNRDRFYKEKTYLFNIRLKDINFIHEFMENLFQKNIEFKNSHKRELKLKEILK
jgi:hypothetical protein